MKEPLPLSDEILNAFVDNEIEGEELERVLSIESNNQDVAKAICEIRRIKSLAKAARVVEPGNVSNIYLRKKRRIKIWYAAASLVLVILVLVVSSVPTQKPQFVSYTSVSTYSDSNALLEAASHEQNLKLVLHLKSADREAAINLLEVLQSILSISEQHGRNLQVEVIASGPGIHLLSNSSDVYVTEIRSIHSRYPNVTFIACGKSLKRIKKNKPVDVQLLKGSMLVASGAQWARQRQQQGWAYVHI